MIYNTTLVQRWVRIKRHLTSTIKIEADELNGTLRLEIKDQVIFIAKNSSKMRLKSHLDWAYYTPKSLANAINNDLLDAYYEVMLNDINSDPNIWKEEDVEMELKSFYAARNKRASLV